MLVFGENVELCWVELNCVELSWIVLSWVEFCWVVLSWVVVELCWIWCNWTLSLLLLWSRTHRSFACHNKPGLLCLWSWSSSNRCLLLGPPASPQHKTCGRVSGTKATRKLQQKSIAIITSWSGLVTLEVNAFLLQTELQFLCFLLSYKVVDMSKLTRVKNTFL